MKRALVALALVLAFAGTAQATTVRVRMDRAPAQTGPYELNVGYQGVGVDPVTGRQQTWDMLPCLNDETEVYVGLVWDADVFRGDALELTDPGAPIYGSGTPNERLNASTLWKDWWLSNEMGYWLNPGSTSLPAGLQVDVNAATRDAIHTAIWEYGTGTPNLSNTWVQKAEAAYDKRVKDKVGYADDLKNIWVLRPTAESAATHVALRGKGIQPFLLADGSYIPQSNVPEPATWVLLGLGTFAAGLRRRRRAA